MRVKRGCVLGPTLFSIFLSAMFDEAFRDMGDGVYIQSRQSADLFNVAHFRAKTKTTRILMRELLFADDKDKSRHHGTLLARGDYDSDHAEKEQYKDDSQVEDSKTGRHALRVVRDSLSNGERSGNRPAPNPPPRRTTGTVVYRTAFGARRERPSPRDRGFTQRECQACTALASASLCVIGVGLSENAAQSG
ncbi:hypothetical protein NP493_556g01005 [Ridgeia piscesae]|uniref:Uncharacterized protein n=1 Tax=Ridgeia piscesae TaxID=27915 RepID=A0AAD9KWR8_RIDPI|nr:hypothetical protein NP493_556g01005 [Ridgeia piscesae]